MHGELAWSGSHLTGSYRYSIRYVSTRALSWDHPNKHELPVHVIVDGFEDLRDPFFDSLGEWGPCMGAQFLKCPPYDPVHAEFMRRVGLLFDIDLTCKLTPAYYSVGLPDPQPVRVGLP